MNEKELKILQKSVEHLKGKSCNPFRRKASLLKELEDKLSDYGHFEVFEGEFDTMPVYNGVTDKKQLLEFVIDDAEEKTSMKFYEILDDIITINYHNIVFYFYNRNYKEELDNAK